MTGLVADIGGTNARIGLVPPGAARPQAVVRQDCDGAPGIVALLDAYLAAQGRPAIDGVAVAIAGPVVAGRGRLTNRDWPVSEDDLTRALGVPARLVNDMAALGLGVADLGDAAHELLRPAGEGAPQNGQALVVNAGTGVNVCPLRHVGASLPALSESEAGHAALSAPIAARLAQAIGGAGAARFETLEDLFAGPGLARLHEARIGAPAAGFRAAVLAGEADALATLDLAAGLFGQACADLALRHWPGEGLYLAGSAARAMAGRRAAFLSGLGAGNRMAGLIADIPVRVVTEDLAPLCGCATLVRNMAENPARG